MQLTNRMGRGGNNPSGIIDVDLELSAPVHNPLHPSSAYLESQKRARGTSTTPQDRNPVNHHVRPGLRTIASAVLLFFGGIVLLILGTVVFCDTSRVASKDQGLDMLVIGAVSKF